MSATTRRIISMRQPFSLLPASLRVTLLLGASLVAQIAAQETSLQQRSVPAAETLLTEQDKPSNRLHVLPQDPPSTQLFQTQLRRTPGIINDSKLNDLCAVGASCWVVGENGVLLVSRDSGKTFTESVLPFSCSLNSVCFLTNQIGFVGGSRFDKTSGWQKAVLLKTFDGGRSWIDLTTEKANSTGTSIQKMPPLSDLKFFDLENGICIAESSRSATPSGVYRTSNGGLTWTQLKTTTAGSANDIDPKWTHLHFSSANQAMVIGQQNATGTVINDQLIVLSQPRPTPQTMHDLFLGQDGIGWMVGDAASILKSDDGGLTWQTVDHAIKANHQHLRDLSCVCTDGATVLIAGCPGNQILRSEDSGQTWTTVSTSQPLPLNRICFTGNDTFLAIGAFGLIVRSEDRGQTWSATRNPDYRAAIVNFATDITSVPSELLVNVSSNDGYRSVVIQPSMKMDRGVVTDLQQGAAVRRRMAELGVNEVCQDWMFARSNPEQIERFDEVLSTWQKQTDGHVIQQLPERLALWIRTWRPDVICVEPAGEEDGVAHWIRQALPTACQIAAGEVQVSAAIQQTQLPVWSVKRIVEKTFDGRSTSLLYSESDLLPAVQSTSGLLTQRLRRTTESDATLASTDTLANTATAIQSSSYKLTLDRANRPSVHHLMSGFQTPPGSDCRRKMEPVSDQNLQKMEQLTSTVQTQNQIAENRISRHDRALGLIAELSTMNQSLPPVLAIQQMETLIGIYQEAGNLDGQIAVMKELVQRYPQSEAAVKASVQLFHYYSSAELRRLRKQKSTGETAGGTSDPQSTLRQVAADRQESRINQAGGMFKGVQQETGQGTLLGNPIADDSQALEIQWDRNAKQALDHLNSVAPEVLSSAEIKFQQAALFRRAGQSGQASTSLADISRMDHPMASVAAAEIGIRNGAVVSQVRTLNLPPTKEKPWLDGQLDDQCWIDAEELHLKSTQEADARADSPCLMMLSWDDDHLYFAGRIDRLASREVDADQESDRIRDADHEGIDRFELALDIDRDYSSALILTIDERGQTSDACWHDRSWDPEWFVATQQDANVWRFEAAIPLSELVDRPPRPGQLWSIRMTRTAPGICRQVLVPHEQEYAARTDHGIGFLRFIRRKQ